MKIDKEDFGQVIVCVLFKVRRHGFSYPISWHRKINQPFLVFGELQKQNVCHGALTERVHGQHSFLEAVDLWGPAVEFERI